MHNNTKGWRLENNTKGIHGIVSKFCPLNLSKAIDWNKKKRNVIKTKQIFNWNVRIWMKKKGQPFKQSNEIRQIFESMLNHKSYFGNISHLELAKHNLYHYLYILHTPSWVRSQKILVLHSSWARDLAYTILFL